MTQFMGWNRLGVIVVWVAIVMFMPGCGGSGSGDGGPTWTVMVYLDGDNNLEGAALADLNEMEAATADPDTRVIVLFDRSRGNSLAQGNWAETRLYEIRHDTDPSVIASDRLTDPTWLEIYGDDGDELNMGREETLRDFVAFCKATYPSDHTALVLWDHGSGWAPPLTGTATPGTKAIAIDDTSEGDALSIKAVAGALAGQGVDVLGFDACLMAQVEVAWELRGSARYMVASQGVEPASGWDYTGLLNRFVALADGDRTPEAWALCATESYMGTARGDLDLTLSVVDLHALFPLGEAVNALAAEMARLGPDAVTAARYRVAGYNENTCVDLRQFAEALGASADTRGILDAALSGAVVENIATGEEEVCGLSVYFPVFGLSSGLYEAYYTAEYLAFVEATDWAGALEAYREGAFYCTVETVPGDEGVDTRLDIYSESLALVASNDDKAGGNDFSRVAMPLARGQVYYIRVVPSGGVFYPSPAGSYGLRVSPGILGAFGAPVDAIGSGDDAFEDAGDDSWQTAADITPGPSAQVHYLGQNDKDWVRVRVPLPE